MSKTNKILTCCGDVVELLYHKGYFVGCSFYLCKTLVLENTECSDSGKWSYMFIGEKYYYPIIITEEYAKIILENPEEGKNWYIIVGGIDTDNSLINIELLEFKILNSNSSIFFI